MSKQLSFGPRPTEAELDQLFPLPEAPRPYYPPTLLAQTLADASRVLESHGVRKSDRVNLKQLPSGAITVMESALVPKDEVWLMDEQGRIGVLKLRGGT